MRLSKDQAQGQIGKAGERAQWLKHLMPKSEDLSSSLQHPHKSMAQWCTSVFLALGKGPVDLGDSKPASVTETVKSGLVRDTISNNKVEKWLKKTSQCQPVLCYLMLSTFAHMYVQKHTSHKEVMSSL
jgi:hypothetical protein